MRPLLLTFTGRPVVAQTFPLAVMETTGVSRIGQPRVLLARSGEAADGGGQRTTWSFRVARTTHRLHNP